MSISRRACSALALAALMPVIAACGSDDDGPGDAYRSDLKKICEETGRQTAKIEQPTGADPAALRRYLEEQEAAAKAQNQKLHDLKPPGDLKSAHDDALKAAEQTVDLFSNTAREIKEGASRAALAKALGPLQSEGADLNKRAQTALDKIGVPECTGGS